MSDASIREEIVALEKSYWDAMKAKDGKRTAELSGNGALVTGARGVMKIAKAKMGEMTEKGDWKLNSYEFADVEVATPASNIAIIAYTVHQNMTMEGKEIDRHAAQSSTWVKGISGWECYGHSETFLDDQKHSKET